MFEYAVILAAGKGQRLGRLMENSTKAMIRVRKRPLISYTLDQIIHKIPGIIITVGRNPIELISYALERNVSSFINTKDKGNAWWLFNSPIKNMNHPIIVFPCDNITTIDLDFIYSNYMDLKSPPCMLVPVPVNENIEGDFIHTNANEIIKITREEPGDIYSSGIQVINPYLLNLLGNSENDFFQLWKSLIEHGLLACSETYPYRWFSVNDARQLKIAEQIIQTFNSTVFPHLSL